MQIYKMLERMYEKKKMIEPLIIHIINSDINST